MASNGSKHCRKISHRLFRAHVPELLSDTRQQPFIGLELLMINDKVRPDLLIPVNLSQDHHSCTFSRRRISCKFHMCSSFGMLKRKQMKRR
ncbi:unnamed protein product [Brassica oleracea]